MRQIRKKRPGGGEVTTALGRCCEALESGHEPLSLCSRTPGLILIRQFAAGDHIQHEISTGLSDGRLVQLIIAGLGYLCYEFAPIGVLHAVEQFQRNSSNTPA